MTNRIIPGSGELLVVIDSAKSSLILSKVIFVFSGAERNIGLHKKIVSRLPDPYDNSCTHTYLNKTIGNLSGPEFESFAQSCEAMCYRIKLYDAWQCIYHEIYHEIEMNICNITPTSKDWNCVLKLFLWILVFDPTYIQMIII